ncbi:hypothetical protein D3C86_1829130 [compost metagenome]
MTDVHLLQRLPQDATIAHHLDADAFDHILKLAVASDDVAQRLVQQHDHGDDGHAMDKRNVGIEHGIADRRTERDHQQELHQ